MIQMDIETILNKMAEEAAELSAASTKLLRKMFFADNPTPKTEQECMKEVVEEMADVFNCMDAFLCNSCMNEKDYLESWKKIHTIADSKMKRWEDRVAEFKDGRAHWAVYENLYKDGKTVVMCSKCGHELEDGVDYKTIHICPNCGKTMEEER